MNTSIQKIIKIGSSLGVTIPAKELKRAGLKPGDEVKLNWEPTRQEIAEDKLELIQVSQKLIKRHKKALENLSRR